MRKGRKQTSSGEIQLELALERVAWDNDKWLAEAAAIIREVAATKATFSADDIWASLEAKRVPPPRDPRCMGVAFRRACSAGLVEHSRNYIKSARPVCHRRPIPVYTRKDET